MLRNILKAGLVLPILSFFLFSCEESGEIGKSLYGDDILSNVYFTDTLTVKASTVYTDSVRTSYYTYMMLGNIAAGQVGEFNAMSYTHLSYPENVSLENDYVLDSGVVAIPIGRLLGELKKPVTIEVYELGANLDSGYYTANSTIALGNLIGTRTFVPDSLVADTIPNVEITISKDFTQRIFDGIKNGSISSQASFENAVNGIAFKLVGDNFLMNPSIAPTGIINNVYKIFYREVAGGEEFFEIGFPFRQRFNGLTSDLSKGKIKDLESKKVLASDEIGGEAISHLLSNSAVRIEFPYLPEFLKDRKVSINKAELNFSVVNDSDYSNELPSTPTLYFSIGASNGEVQRTAEGDPNFVLNESRSRVAEVSFAEGGQTYTSVDLTSYMEALTLPETNVRFLENNGLFVWPEPRTSVSIFNPARINVNSLNGTPLKLKVYYTLYE